MGFLRFLRDNAAWLFAGALLSFLSSFGQTFFIAIFSAEIRATFGLSDGAWGGIYTLGTGASAIVMLFAGGLTDRLRVRVLGTTVVACLGLACFAMALNPVATLLPIVIFALRLFGQGMTSHVAIVAMARWFVATRGRALAVATLGFSLGEAALPLTFVWLKRHFEWHLLWIGAGLFCFAMVPVLVALLRRERTPQSVAEDSSAPGMDGRQWTRGAAIRQPLFWVLAVSLMLFPAFGTAFWFHQVHFAAVKGWDHFAFVTIFPLGTLVFAGSTIVYGWAIDKVGSARLMPLYMGPLALGFFVLAYAPSVPWAALGIILMGIAGGGQATLPAACWAELFGTRHIGAIKAVVAAFLVLGSAVGPGLTGWLIDIGYPLPRQLVAYGVMFLVASGAMVVPLRGAVQRLALPA
jgi:MFS family permease